MIAFVDVSATAATFVKTTSAIILAINGFRLLPNDVGACYHRRRRRHRHYHYSLLRPIKLGTSFNLLTFRLLFNIMKLAFSAVITAKTLRAMTQQAIVSVKLLLNV